MQALSQLSYSPERGKRSIAPTFPRVSNFLGPAAKRLRTPSRTADFRPTRALTQPDPLASRLSPLSPLPLSRSPSSPPRGARLRGGVVVCAAEGGSGLRRRRRRCARLSASGLGGRRPTPRAEPHAPRRPRSPRGGADNHPAPQPSGATCRAAWRRSTSSSRWCRRRCAGGAGRAKLARCGSPRCSPSRRGTADTGRPLRSPDRPPRSSPC